MNDNSPGNRPSAPEDNQDAARKGGRRIFRSRHRGGLEKDEFPTAEMPAFRANFSGPDRAFGLDQFRVLRNRILFPEASRIYRTVGVTSVAPGEGKTFIAANLGYFLSRNVDGKEALLIDGDLRLPSLHESLGMPGVPGLSEYLAEDAPLDSVVRKTRWSNLSLLPGGMPPENASELFSSDKMLRLLDELGSRNENRHVLLDLPSPKLVPESAVVAREVDGIVLVVRCGKTPRDEVKSLIEMLGSDRIMGVVLNQFDTSLHSSLFRMYRKFIRRKR